MPEKEIWKDIEGYEGKYQVSNLGRVRSLLNIRGNKREIPKILKGYLDRYGYLLVRLYKNSKPKPLLVHRLVAKDFIPNPKNKSQVNHINGIKTDNRVRNLEWDTAKENTRHAFDNGLSPRGEIRSTAKFTKKQVEQIRKEYIPYSRSHSYRALAKKYGVSKETIYLIIKYKTYKKP